MNASNIPAWLDRLSGRARWRLHLAILCCPIFLTLLPVHFFSFPQNIFQLAVFFSLELLIWGVVFTAAFRVSGSTASQLRLVTRHPLRVIGYGFLWFLAIRILVALILWVELQWIDPRWLWAMDEKISSVMHAKNIVPHPVFSGVLFGMVSLLAGFSEELWRSGMLAGLGGLFPQFKRKGPGTFAGIFVIALLFGVAHSYQGWFGVENAVLQGIFLGLILVYRNSYWEAAIAHVLFDGFAFATLTVMMLCPHLMNPQIVSGAYHGDVHRVAYLLEMGADINGSSDWRGVTALEAAAYRTDPDMARFLLDRGASPNVKDIEGETPLILAAEKNQLEIIKLLVAKGADLNWRNERGFTALRAAVQLKRVEAARLLIDSGADLNPTDKEGLTPLQAAQNLGYSDLEILLQQKGGK